MLLALVGFGGIASMAKSFNVYGDSVRSVEDIVGGAWVLHVVIASLLGFVAAWTTPNRQSNSPFSPLVVFMALLVATDELLQYVNPARQFSIVDMMINVTCITLGSTFYLLITSPQRSN